MKTEPTEALKSLSNLMIEEESSFISDETAYNLIHAAFAEGQSSPKIKQLEWKEEVNGYTTLQSPFMSKYDVQYSELHNGFKPRVNYRDGSYWINSLIFDTAEEAKNFCHEDYERRVKECLE